MAKKDYIDTRPPEFFPQEFSSFLIRHIETNPTREANSETIGATKHDAGKPRYDLIPYDALKEIAKVLSFGASKYQDRNWEKGFSYSRPFRAAVGHLCDWFLGEENDPESGLSHLAHAACNILFLLTFRIRKTGADDRPK